MGIKGITVGDFPYSGLDRSKDGDGRVKVIALPLRGTETLALVLRQREHPMRTFDASHPQMKAEHVAQAVAQEEPDAGFPGG